MWPPIYCSGGGRINELLWLAVVGALLLALSFSVILVGGMFSLCIVDWILCRRAVGHMWREIRGR